MVGALKFLEVLGSILVSLLASSHSCKILRIFIFNIWGVLWSIPNFIIYFRSSSNSEFSTCPTEESKERGRIELLGSLMMKPRYALTARKNSPLLYVGTTAGRAAAACAALARKEPQRFVATRVSSASATSVRKRPRQAQRQLSATSCS